MGPAPLVNGAAVVADGQTGAAATVCAPGSLDPAEVAGTIVVCARGVVDRVVKSAEVERAGGVGMVLVNLTANTLDADLHSVPTVHLDPPASALVTAYAATPGATATLTEGNQTDTELAYPQIASLLRVAARRSAPVGTRSNPTWWRRASRSSGPWRPPAATAATSGSCPGPRRPLRRWPGSPPSGSGPGSGPPGPR